MLELERSREHWATGELFAIVVGTDFDSFQTAGYSRTLGSILHALYGGGHPIFAVASDGDLRVDRAEERTVSTRSLIVVPTVVNDVAREVHRRDHIGNVSAARDHEWPLVDHTIVDFPSFILYGMVPSD